MGIAMCRYKSFPQVYLIFNVSAASTASKLIQWNLILFLKHLLKESGINTHIVIQVQIILSF